MQHLYLNLNVSAARTLHLAHELILTQTVAKVLIGIYIYTTHTHTHSHTKEATIFTFTRILVYKVGLKSFENSGRN